MPDRVGDDLARQVDLDRRVDRDHPAERADDVGVVREVDRRASRPSGCRATNSYRRCVPIMNAVTILPRLRSLRGAGDDARLDEVDDGVREHLGVDRRGRACRVRSQRRRAPGSRRSRAGASRRRGRGPRRARRSAARRRRSTGPGCSYGGTSTSTARSMSSTWMKLSPSVRGIARLSWTMTVFAARIAACIASTLRPERAEPVGVGRRGVDEDRVERQRPATRTAAGRRTGRPARSRPGPRSPRRARSAR